MSRHQPSGAYTFAAAYQELEVRRRFVHALDAADELARRTSGPPGQGHEELPWTVQRRLITS